MDRVDRVDRVDRGSLLPGCQIKERDGDGVTGHQGVAKEKTGLVRECLHSLLLTSRRFS